MLIEYLKINNQFFIQNKSPTGSQHYWVLMVNQLVNNLLLYFFRNLLILQAMVMCSHIDFALCSSHSRLLVSDMDKWHFNKDKKILSTEGKAQLLYRFFSSTSEISMKRKCSNESNYYKVEELGIFSVICPSFVSWLLPYLQHFLSKEQLCSFHRKV